MRDESNWPGADPNGPFDSDAFRPAEYTIYPVLIKVLPAYRFEKKNWYYYYKNTPADKGCIYHYERSKCDPGDDPNYTPYVGRLADPYHHVNAIEVNDVKIKNYDQVLWGIDIYAWASRHEKRHHDDYHKWWGKKGVIDANEQDGDHVPDANEPNFPKAAGGPYDPTRQTTLSAFNDIGLDDQSICMFTQEIWTKDEHTHIDWAYPGSRWHP